MPSPVAILALATAKAPYELPQREVAEVARRLFEDCFPQFDRMAGVFETAGVRTRQAVRPIEWYLQPRGWPERTQAYLEGATDMFVHAAQGALDEAGLRGCDVDIVVTVSSTGIATPSLEARVMTRLGLRPDIARVPVFGLGCAGGAAGLGIASRLARGSPGAVVLFVAVEVCTSAFRLQDVAKADIVATALFGDGAAACILRSGEDGFAQVTGSAEHTWPNTLDIMGWNANPDGLGVVFARSIPSFVRSHLRPVMQEMLARCGLEMDGVDRFVCHPGGMKVIDGLESSLSLGQGALDHERGVLADRGNMSAPTVLHVLDRVRRDRMPDRSVLTALGPGFSASAVALARAA